MRNFTNLSRLAALLLSLALWGGSQDKDKQVKLTPIEVVQKYYSAKSVEQRYQYVVQSQSVSNKMNVYYSTFNLSDLKTNDVESITITGSTNSSPVRVSLLKKQINIPIVYYVTNTPAGYKIDWEQSTFYSKLDAPQSVILKYLGTSNQEDMTSFLYPTIDLEKKRKESPLRAFAHEQAKKGEVMSLETQGILPDGKTELWNLLGESNNILCQFCLRKYDGGYRILWEPTTLYNPITFTKLKALMPTEAYEMRVLAKLDTYYNYEYRDAQNTCLSILLRDPRTEEMIHGYLGKQTDDASSVIDLLQDGQWHYMVVKIQYNPVAVSPSIIRIADVVDLSVVGPIEESSSAKNTEGNTNGH